MRPASAGLIAYLLSNPACFSADLFTINLATGGTIYLTSFDQPITSGGIVYSNNNMTIERTSWEVKNTTEVPNMDIVMYSNGADFNEGNFKLLAHQGLLDGAVITLNRAFMPTPNNVALGTVLLFGGRVSVVTVSATAVKITVKGFNVLMQQYMPKNIFSLGCIHNLYDVNCKAVKASFTLSSTVGSSGINSIFVPWSAAPGNPALYNLGSLTFTSGAAIGQVRTVNFTTSGGMSLAYPLYDLPAPGDSFSVAQGCNKTMSTCQNTFGNLQNFRGFPFIPPEETAY